MTTTRRLAAILAADVAGYSRLTGKDDIRISGDTSSSVSSEAMGDVPRFVDIAVSGARPSMDGVDYIE